MSRLPGRIRIIPRALARFATGGRRRKPAYVRRVLIAHHLLLGDTLLLTPLLAKLRDRYPEAEIVLLCPKPIVPLYAGRPFDVTALPFDPRDPATVKAILRSGPYDLGFVMGDNRHSWLAFAAGCSWIRAHSGDMPVWKNWPVDESIPYPAVPAAWADLAADMVDGPAPRPYHPADWPAPPRPASMDAHSIHAPYIVLHPGASGAVKQWPDARWRELARAVDALGYVPVWSGGGGEVSLIHDIDPGSQHLSLAGRLDLAERWHLFEGAAAVVSPDTGVAHLARLVSVPAVALFGPGNAAIHGAGRYWRSAPFFPITVADMPCRDQPFIFRRKVAWVRRCDRNSATCVAWREGYADCMGRIPVESVVGALQRALSTERRPFSEP
jgi:ADP-heptose:LPS heptosyltransferase